MLDSLIAQAIFVVFRQECSEVNAGGKTVYYTKHLHMTHLSRVPQHVLDSVKV